MLYQFDNLTIAFVVGILIFIVGAITGSIASFSADRIDSKKHCIRSPFAVIPVMKNPFKTQHPAYQLFCFKTQVLFLQMQNSRILFDYRIIIRPAQLVCVSVWGILGG